MTQEKQEEMTIANALAISKLTEVSQRTSEDVDKMIKHFEASKPLIADMDALKTELENVDRKLNILQPVFTILRYPKFALLAVIGAYALAISDVRQGFVGLLLKLFG